jgi:hypothetical protein
LDVFIGYVLGPILPWLDGKDLTTSIALDIVYLFLQFGNLATARENRRNKAIKS